MKKQILIIEDERDLVLLLEDRLTEEGYLARKAFNGIQGEAEAKKNIDDLIILDIMLPGRDGFEVCQNLRIAHITVPILMLTARNTNLDTVVGLRTGADDYLAKPFDMDVLLARIQAILRRNELVHQKIKSKQDFILFGDFVLDRIKRELSNKGRSIPLSLQEYRLVEYLAENPGRAIDRNELLDQVWGYETMTTTRTVDVHIACIRKKMDESEKSRHIHTIRGFGYKFLPKTS